MHNPHICVVLVSDIWKPVGVKLKMFSKELGQTNWSNFVMTQFQSGRCALYIVSGTVLVY